MARPISNCCGVVIPGYPDSDVCPKCKEHCGVEEVSDRPEKKNCPVLYPNTAAFVNGKLFGWNDCHDAFSLWLSSPEVREGIHRVVAGYTLGSLADSAEEKIAAAVVKFLGGEK
jgi:hypothetical protein